ncbi:MAG: arsenate reductase family protein [Acutalibacteraceae bacterium]|nr:arsenate reductase family protein [Acutalibacteraceae bacterium]
MNIQIFGTKKSADTRKAQRYFQERRIKFQFVDLSQKGMSKGEFESVASVVGGVDAMIDENCKDQKTLTLIKYLVPDQKLEKILENQQVLKQPVVRNGKQATLGYQPDVWKTWE